MPALDPKKTAESHPFRFQKNVLGPKGEKELHSPFLGQGTS